MKHLRSSLAAAAGLYSLLLAPLAQVDTWNHKTKFEFSEPVELPGKVLPAGTYIFKLMNSDSDCYIVQVFNADETQIQGTFLTLSDKRMKATGKTVSRSAEPRKGSWLGSFPAPDDNQCALNSCAGGAPGPCKRLQCE
jgi:hypothetical protein